MPGPVFFFFLLVGLVTVVMAIRFAFAPAERTLAVVRPLCAATITSSLAAFFAGVANGLTWLARSGQASQVSPWTIVGGFAESLIALILGFALVSVAWLLTAVGLHRQA
jgi:hypothetical protein